jgi:hypothetical protein
MKKLLLVGTAFTALFGGSAALYEVIAKKQVVGRIAMFGVGPSLLHRIISEVQQPFYGIIPLRSPPRAASP